MINEKTIAIPHKDAFEYSLLLSNDVHECPDEKIQMEEFSVDFGTGLRASINLLMLDHFYVSPVLMKTNDNGKEQAVLELPAVFRLLGEYIFVYEGDTYIARIVDEQDVVYTAGNSFDSDVPYTKEMIEEQIDQWVQTDLGKFPELSYLDDDQIAEVKYMLYSMVVTSGAAGQIHPSTALDQLDDDDIDSIAEQLGLQPYITEPHVVIEVRGGVAEVVKNSANVRIQIIDHDNKLAG